MTSYNQNEKREIIMKHYSTPNNKHEGHGKVVDVYSNRCVDELHLQFDIKDNVINNISFTGVGCAVFLASTDIVIDLLKGKTLDEAQTIAKAYETMINQSGSYDASLLGEANVFDNVKTHLNRLDCAEMIVRGIKKMTE